MLGARTNGIVLMALLGGCAASAPTKAPEQAPTPRAAAPSADLPAPVPSLADEQAIQAWREAQALSRRLALPIDAVTSGEAPAWWNPALRTAAFGTARGRGLEPTLALAGRQAEGIARERDADLARNGRVIRGAYARLSSGEYVAWSAFARAGDAIALEPVVAPRLAAQPEAMPLPAVAPSMPTLAQPNLPRGPMTPEGGSPAPAIAGPSLPGWWHEDPVEAGGRVTVCAMAVSEDAREAPRQAVRAARQKLARLSGGEVSGLITHKQETREVEGGRVAAYVMVSMPRTMTP